MYLLRVFCKKNGFFKIEMVVNFSSCKILLLQYKIHICKSANYIYTENEMDGNFEVKIGSQHLF